MSDLKPIIAKLADGEILDAQTAELAFSLIMSGEATPSQIGAVLMGLRLRGETSTEIASAVRVMRSKMLRVDAPDNAIDIVGTGGDQTGSYNISTATAFVVAACGVPVAKHGNRAMSSRSGAADVLVALGVNIELGSIAIQRCINEAGLGFMFAPVHHKAVKYVGPTRVEMGIRTIFNLLGPLSNPAGVKRQLLGVFDRKWLIPLAEALRDLGSSKVWIVHGNDGLDEISTTGPTEVVALEGGEIRQFQIQPSDIQVPVVDLSALKGGDAEHNAAAIRAMLLGEPGPLRDVVLFNAAAALMIADQVGSLREGAARAADAIDRGNALARLDRLAVISNEGG